MLHAVNTCSSIVPIIKRVHFRSLNSSNHVFLLLRRLLLILRRIEQLRLFQTRIVRILHVEVLIIISQHCLKVRLLIEKLDAGLPLLSNVGFIFGVWVDCLLYVDL